MAKPISRVDYGIISQNRRSIVVGTFNFALADSRVPEHYSFHGRAYDFSEAVPVPEEFEHRVCFAAKYELAPRSKRAATLGETLVQRAVRSLRQDPAAPSRLVHHPYFQAQAKKRWGFIRPGWLSLAKRT